MEIQNESWTDKNICVCGSRSFKLQTTNLYWKSKWWSIERIAVLFLEAAENWQAAQTTPFEEFIPNAAYQGDLTKEF